MPEDALVGELMPNIPTPPVPLEATAISCWRCGGATPRHPMDTSPCATCVAALDEIARRYQGRPVRETAPDAPA